MTDGEMQTLLEEILEAQHKYLAFRSKDLTKPPRIQFVFGSQVFQLLCEFLKALVGKHTEVRLAPCRKRDQFLFFHRALLLFCL